MTKKKSGDGRVVTIEDRLALMGCREECTRLCAQYGVTLFEAQTRNRSTHVAAARHAVWHLLHTKGWSNNQIGKLWGVHHTTVGDALDKKKSLEGGPGGEEPALQSSGDGPIGDLQNRQALSTPGGE